MALPILLTTRNLPKNLSKIAQSVIRNSMIAIVILIISAVAAKQFEWATSIALGSIFSYLSFLTLLDNWQVIHQAQPRKHILFGILKRLVLVGVPVGISIAYPTYFNLVAILISLFTFQINLVMFELITSLKKYYKRQSEKAD